MLHHFSHEDPMRHSVISLTIISGHRKFLSHRNQSGTTDVGRIQDQNERGNSCISVTLSSQLSFDDLHKIVLRAFRLPRKSLLAFSLNGRVLRNGVLSLRELNDCVLEVHPHVLPGGMLQSHHEQLRQLHSEVEMLEAVLDEACQSFGDHQIRGRMAEGTDREAGIAHHPEFQLSDDSAFPFTEDDDDQEVILGLFRDIDIDNNNTISIAELRAAIHRYSMAGNGELCSVFEDLIDTYASNDRNIQISFDDFSEVFRKLPRVKGERVKWAATLGMEGQLARLLVKGDPFDGLKELRNIGGTEMELHIQEVCQRFTAMLPDMLRRALAKLKRTGQVQTSLQEHINSKFVLDGAYVGRFATLDDFYRGPEALIGVPNPRIREGAEKEHCQRPNAQRRFTTSNYNITTWPQLEWEFVVCPVDDAPEYRRYPHTPSERSQWMLGNEWRGAHGRDIITLHALMEDPAMKLQVTKAGLLQEEVICLRLYTGGPCDLSSRLVAQRA